MDFLKGKWISIKNEVIQFSDMLENEKFHLDYNYNEDDMSFMKQDVLILYKTNEKHYHISESEKFVSNNLNILNKDEIEIDGIIYKRIVS